jgi:hypothetical protein
MFDEFGIRDHCNSMTLSTAHYLVPMAHTPTNVDLLGEADNSTWLATSDPIVDCLPQFPTKSRSAPGDVVANPHRVNSLVWGDSRSHSLQLASSGQFWAATTMDGAYLP